MMSQKTEALPREDDNESEDENFPFYVNKAGFPVDEQTWERMWKYAAKLYPDAKSKMDQIKNSDTLAEVPVPSVPVFHPQSTVSNYLHLVQNYINSLHYNHTGTQLFEIKKSRPLAGLMDKAKEMIREALPIKCLEAVILALYLTNCVANVVRFPIGFKSRFNGHYYYHVVLGISYKGRFGALGISRRLDLMDKPLVFKSLYDLIENYDAAYSRYTHQLKKVRIGGSVPHDMCSQERIPWGICAVNMAKASQSEQQRKLDRYGRDLKSHGTYVASPSPMRDKPRAPRREHTMAAVIRDHLCEVTRVTKSANVVKKTEGSDSVKYQLKI